MTATLDLIAWNCYVANSDENVERALRAWISDYNPEVIALSEARTHRSALEAVARDRGYTLQQRKPVRARKGRPVNDAGDCAILTRDDVEVIRRYRARMRLAWIVSRYRRVHTPREAEIVVIRHAGRKWRVRASHWPTNGFDGPNRKPFLESATKAKAWALASSRRTVSVDVGDFNETKARLAKWFGKRFKVVGKGIDLLIGRNLHAASYRELTKGGGDHHGRVYHLTA